MTIIKIYNSIIRYILLICFLLFSQFCFHLHAQKVRSGKTTFNISSLEIEEEHCSDVTPPLLKIISPDFNQEEKIKSQLPEITLIGKITDSESGVNRVFINSKEYKLADDGLFIHKILLKRGDNKINIIAIDNRDNLLERNIVIEKVVESESFITHLNIAGDYYALLIGIDNYNDPNLMNLDNPVRDAENVYEVLITDYYFNEENVILKKDAKRSDIIDALDLLAEKLTKDDNLIIFYAGHGFWDEEANVGYWLPSDARRSRKAEWLSNSRLCDYLKLINSKHTLLIADACFGGSIFKTRSAFMVTPKANQMLYDLPSRKAMTSGTLTKVPDRSSFVEYFIERLSTNEVKYISSEKLYSSFREAVMNNSDNVPQYGVIRNVGDQGGEFIFIKRD